MERISHCRVTRRRRLLEQKINRANFLPLSWSPFNNTDYSIYFFNFLFKGMKMKKLSPTKSFRAVYFPPILPCDYTIPERKTRYLQSLEFFEEILFAK